tara:strand:- start:1697 stop:2041 length:345 start_codon:yes stop_codon:yes gene_type:complete
MRDGGEGVLLGVLILGLLLASTGTPSIDQYERDGTITCRTVVGEVVHKEAPFELYVEVQDNIAGEREGYHVYVSPEVFANYSVGDTHEEAICTFTDYEYFRDIIEQLKQSGILN